MTNKPLLADGVEYIHGMNIYDIHSNEKDGDYISNNFTLNYLDSFDVNVGGKVYSNNAGWYLCHGDNVLSNGMEVVLSDFYSSADNAASAYKAMKRAEIEKKIATLTEMLKELQ